MEKTRVLFLAHTEYHIMTALSIIAEKYSDILLFHVDIIQTQDSENNRFQFKYSTDIAKNIFYEVLFYDENDFNYNKSLVKTIEKIIANKYKICVIFNHHAYLPVYLTKLLYRKGTEIHLAPDGLKTYNTNRGITPRWSLMAAYSFFRFCKANKFNFYWHIPKLGYANLKEIKTLYIDFPNAYDNYTHKKIEQLNVFDSPLSKKMIINYFNFDFAQDLDQNHDIIFYINQPTRSKSLYDFEIEVLSFLTKRFPQKKVVVKLHPLTDLFQLERMKQINGVQFISKSYPAELYIMQLVDSIVVSFWSTACLTNNDKTKIYWLTNIINQRKMMFNFNTFQNPTTHIIEVNDLAEIN